MRGHYFKSWFWKGQAKRRLGSLYFRVTGNTCRWHPYADLHHLLNQILKRT